MSDKGRDIIKGLLAEAQAYTSIDDLEKYVESGKDLSALPVQPLYMVIRSLSPDIVAHYLPRFSKEQREAFLDLDLWEKDQLDTQNFSTWLPAYVACPDESVSLEFAKSDQFALFLKGKFHISTFDVEDPMYPDHDYYFLTDDNLLLVEYEEDFPYVAELKRLIRYLYDTMGVEKAYAHLFKIVSETYGMLEEEEYRLKKERQRDLGFVDYYDALDIDTPFPNLPVMDNFIKKKGKVLAEVDEVARSQALHKSTLVPYQNGFDPISNELSKVSDSKRMDFLQFNFIRLVNAGLALEGALKDGSLAMSRVGQGTKSLIVLGYNYIRSRMRPLTDSESLFDLFDFVDVYRVGKTLIRDNQRTIKRSLHGTPFAGDHESFLGSYWEEFLDNSFESPVKFRWPGKMSAAEVIDPETADLWARKGRTFVELLPFAHKFFQVFDELRQNGRISNAYYLNYALDDIDMEAILLSSFANYSLGHLEDSKSPKLGLTLDEFRVWVAQIIDKEGHLKNDSTLHQKISSFATSFGLEKVYDFPSYLLEILKGQLEGYEYEKLSFEDFKHVGGPIILSALKN